MCFLTFIVIIATFVGDRSHINLIIRCNILRSKLNMCTVKLKLLKQFSIHKHIIVAIVFTSILKSVHLQQCSKLKFNKNHCGQRLEGFIIVTTTEESIGTCLKKYFQLTHCLSTSFDKVSKQCYLNNVTADEMESAVVKSDKSILSDLSAWPKAMVGSCGDKPCHGHDICLPAGNSFLCRNSDCPKAPLFRNTTSTGSVEIGGENVYKCTQSYHRIIGPDYVHCGWMNTWSSNEEIICTAECPDDWTRYDDSCYFSGGGNDMTFSEAVNYCEGLGADIVQIESADENLFVKDILQRNSGTRHYWLGMTDETEEVWRWYKTGELATYFDWASIEPNGQNNNIEDEDCVVNWVYNQAYKWGDVPCQFESLPFCELRLPV